MCLTACLPDTLHEDLIDYFKGCDSYELSIFESLPMSIDWECKEKGYWVGAYKTNTVLVKLNNDQLIYFKIAQDINPEMSNLKDFIILDNARLIRTNLNTVIDRYIVWEIQGNHIFWLVEGVSMGTKMGQRYMIFIFNRESLKDYL